MHGDRGMLEYWNRELKKRGDMRARDRRLNEIGVENSEMAVLWEDENRALIEKNVEDNQQVYERTFFIVILSIRVW